MAIRKGEERIQDTSSHLRPKEKEKVNRAQENTVREREIYPGPAFQKPPGPLTDGGKTKTV